MGLLSPIYGNGFETDLKRTWNGGEKDLKKVQWYNSTTFFTHTLSFSSFSANKYNIIINYYIIFIELEERYF